MLFIPSSFSTSDSESATSGRTLYHLYQVSIAKSTARIKYSRAGEGTYGFNIRVMAKNPVAGISITLYWSIAAPQASTRAESSQPFSWAKCQDVLGTKGLYLEGGPLLSYYCRCSIFRRVEQEQGNIRMAQQLGQIAEPAQSEPEKERTCVVL